MIGQRKPAPVVVRLAIGAAFGLLGFLYFPLLFLGAFIVWTVIADLRTRTDRSDSLLDHAYDATAKDADWEQRYLSLCESPAEAAFLREMIKAFELTPNAGKLVGQGITLELQACVLRYRLDFLVNTHHGIEIDGAQYHTGEQEEARDAYRDAKLSHSGIRVLRIPATIVFNDPDEAICRVKAFLLSAGPETPRKLPTRPQPVLKNLVERPMAREDIARSKNDQKGDWDDQIPF